VADLEGNAGRCGMAERSAPVDFNPGTTAPPGRWLFPAVSESSCVFRECGVLVVDDALRRSDSAKLESRAAAAVERYGTHVTRASGLDYHVLPGDEVQKRLPSLFDLYREPALLEWLQSLTGNGSVSTSVHLRSSVNVNCLRQRGQAYPWHRDAIAYSAVLFLNSVRSGAGGEFQVERLDGIKQRIRCAPGKLIVFDGSRCRHSDAPLKCDTVRLTVPMVFPATSVKRPRGLDPYLYGEPVRRH
jgi:hypothetical protein